MASLPPNLPPDSPPPASGPGDPTNLAGAAHTSASARGGGGGSAAAASGSDAFSDADFPAPLARDLASLYESRVVLPANLDGRVLDAAAARFEYLRRRRMRVVVRRTAGALAAAAALAIGVFMMVPSSLPPARDVAIANRAEMAKMGEDGKEFKSTSSIDGRRVEAPLSVLSAEADAAAKYGAIAGKPGDLGSPDDQAVRLRSAKPAAGGGGADRRDTAGQPLPSESEKSKTELKDASGRPGGTPGTTGEPAPQRQVATPAADAPANRSPGSAGRPGGAAVVPATGAPATGAPTIRGPVIGDLNSDRTVNILDALLLAQEIARKATGDAAWLAQRDLNADGKVDQKDVDAIALRAVNLGAVQAFFVPKFPRLSGGAS